MLVALKCDLRENAGDEEEDSREPKRAMIDYKQGLAVAEKIRALRYLGTFIHKRIRRTFERGRACHIEREVV